MDKIVNSFGNALQTQWDWRAVGNFTFAGSGGALLLMIAVAYFQNVPAIPVSLTALVLVGLGLFCVWLEIGRPWRFLNVFFHPQTSWMTREASVAVLLFAVTLAGILLRLPLAFTAAGALGLLFLYCQGLILRASKGIPVWREPAVVPLIVLTGLAEGAALLLLLLIFTNQQQPWLFYALPCLLLLRLFGWLRYRHKLAVGKTPVAAIRTLDGIHPLYLIIGNLAPLLLLICILPFPAFTKPFGLAAGVLALFGGWLMKFTVVARAAHVQGYALGKLQKGRPQQIKPPVRRERDRFVFDRQYQGTE
ncbi:MAG: DmsC/YnfH family molybdoenzyme membrane anchor subunit [Gammaproteobacteria bacterium]